MSKFDDLYGLGKDSNIQPIDFTRPLTFEEQDQEDSVGFVEQAKSVGISGLKGGIQALNGIQKAINTGIGLATDGYTPLDSSIEGLDEFAKGFNQYVDPKILRADSRPILDPVTNEMRSIGLGEASRMTAESLPQMAAMYYGGRLATGALTIAGLSGGSAALGGQMISSGAITGSDAYQAAKDKSTRIMQGQINPDTGKQYTDEEIASKAHSAGTEAFAQTAPVSAILGGGALNRITNPKAGAGIFRRIGTGTLAEGSTEFVEEMNQGYAEQNAIQNNIDENYQASTSPFERGIRGAIGGGLSGGAFGAFHSTPTDVEAEKSAATGDIDLLAVDSHVKYRTQNDASQRPSLSDVAQQYADDTAIAQSYTGAASNPNALNGEFIARESGLQVNRPYMQAQQRQQFIGGEQDLLEGPKSIEGQQSNQAYLQDPSIDGEVLGPEKQTPNSVPLGNTLGQDPIDLSMYEYRPDVIYGQAPNPFEDDGSIRQPNNYTPPPQLQQKARKPDAFQDQFGEPNWQHKGGEFIGKQARQQQRAPASRQIERLPIDLSQFEYNPEVIYGTGPLHTPYDENGAIRSGNEYEPTKLLEVKPILRRDKVPYRTKRAAEVAAIAKQLKDYEIGKYDEGFAIYPKTGAGTQTKSGQPVATETRLNPFKKTNGKTRVEAVAESLVEITKTDGKQAATDELNRIAQSESWPSWAVSAAEQKASDLLRTAKNSKVQQSNNGEPTEAQKEAGNYKKIHKSWNGLNIAIENPEGSTRSGKDKSGKAWSSTMQHDYGYIKGTKGNDGDHVDVFIGPNLTSDKVFIVNQTHADGSFDEHKVMTGFNSLEKAEQGYLANYEKGWSNYDGIAEMSVDEFKEWLKSGDQSIKAQTLATQEQIDKLTEIGNDFFRGLDNVNKTVAKKAMNGKPISKSEAEKAINQNADYLTQREVDAKKSDEADHANSEKLYGGKSIQELNKILESLKETKYAHGEVSDGRRSTKKAVNNEAVRANAEQAMKLERYIKQKSEKEAAETIDNTEKPSAKPAKDSQPVKERSSNPTFFELINDVISHARGELSFDEYQDLANSLIDNQESITAEIASMTKKRILDNMGSMFAYRYKSEKKDRIVSEAYKSMLSNLNVGSGITLSFDEVTKPNAYTDKLKASIAKTTKEQYDAFAEKARNSYADHKDKLSKHIEFAKKSADNPETIEEFRQKIKQSGVDSLSPEQRSRYDELIAEKSISKKQDVKDERIKAKAVVDGIESNIDYSLSETVHSQKGHALYVVSLNDRVSKELYTELNRKAKAFGGYYSSYTKDGAIAGFQFKTDENRARFIKVLDGKTVDQTEQLKAKDEDKTDTRVDRLIAMADKIEDANNSALNTNRKTNTAKRIREAATMERSARQQIHKARTLRKIAEGVKSGDVKFLAGITAVTQLDTLLQKLRSLKTTLPDNRVRIDNEGLRVPLDDVTIDEMLKHAVPALSLYKEHWVSDLEDLAKMAGSIRLANSYLKEIKSSKNERWAPKLSDTELLDALKKMVKANPDKYKYAMFKERLDAWSRLLAAGIDNESHYKTALKELYMIENGVEKIKSDPLQDLERSMVGRFKENDWHNTPDKAADNVVSMADVEPEHKVLEPSAGFGHLADAIARAGVPKENIKTVEFANELGKALELKGYNPTYGDFLSFNESGFDRVIMNPPFSKGQDIDHVNHAYSLLKDGGRLVAIVSSMTGDRQNKKDQDFRAFLDDVAAIEEPLPDGTFKDSVNPTGVNTKVLIIDKPESDQSTSKNTRASASENNATGSTTDAVKAAIDGITQNWQSGPKINVVQSMSDLPSNIKNAVKSISETGQADGVYDRATDTVYLIADNIADAEHAQSVLLHESLAHYGLHKLMGGKLDKLLRQIYKTSPKSAINAIVAAYNLDPNNQNDQLVIAEELLAHMAEDYKRPDLLQRIMSMVKQWLRDAGFTLRFTESDVMSLLAKSEKWLKSSKNAELVTDETVRLRVSASGVADAVRQSLRTEKIFNAWWHKTVGTQYHKATLSPSFRKVFNKVQEYLSDSALFAIRAEQRAGDVFTRIESGADAAKNIAGMVTGKSRQHARDMKSVSTALFEGTLAEDGYLSNSELGGKYGLNDRQIKLYRSYIRAIKQSLQEMQKSVITRIAKDYLDPNMIKAIKHAPFKKAVFAVRSELDSISISLAAELESAMAIKNATVTDRVKKHGMSLNDAHNDDAIDNHIADIQKQVAVLVKTTAAVNDSLSKYQSLLDRGYVPLMRFGKFYIKITETNESGDTETVYREHFETEGARNRAIRRLQNEYPDADFETGILSLKQYEMYEGINPDTLAMFADELGISKEPLIQEYLKNAVSDHSALKRMIKRHGIDGFNNDAVRVLASFITSNARLASTTYNMGVVSELINKIDHREGDVKDEAIALQKYVTNPQEEAGRLRGFMFFHYIGGSIASAAVNLTQPLVMTVPYLSQFSKIVGLDATKQVSKAWLESVRGKFGADVEGALDKADAEGHTLPNEVYQLMADARGNMFNSHAMRSFMQIWGSVFSIAETINRKTTFIAAYRMAQKMTDEQLSKTGVSSAYDFAVQAITETQGLYNKGNRPNWARGAVGATLFTFKQFSVTYIEMLKRLPKREKALALMILMMAAGVGGLPFADDAEDLIDTIGGMAGYSTNSRKWLDDTMRDTFGPVFGDFMNRGISSFTPFDVSGRMGLGNLIPGTNMLNPNTDDKTRDIAEFAGAFGGVMQSLGNVITNLGRGDALNATKEAMPLAVRNAWQGIDMANTGYYRDRRGYIVTDVNAVESIFKGMGFHPANVAQLNRDISNQYRDNTALTIAKRKITDMWAQGIVNKDKSMIEKAREQIKKWNERNPNAQMRIDYARSVLRKAKELRKTRLERFKQRTPRELRQQN